MARAAQGGDGGITSHEADQQPLHRRRQADPRGDDLVDARCDEASAAGDHKVRYRIQRNLPAQGGDRRDAECRRGLGIDAHSLGRSRRGVAGVKAAALDRRPAIVGAWQHRPAMCDPRTRRHSVEDPGLTRNGQPRPRPPDEGVMNVMVGNGGADCGDMGGSGQDALSRGPDEVRTTRR